MTPRALETHEIPAIVEQYRQAARNALNARFDGVEIHAANGYLLEQFLRDSTNQRTDTYGGPRENRARLLFEVTEAVASECGGLYGLSRAAVESRWLDAARCSTQIAPCA